MQSFEIQIAGWWLEIYGCNESSKYENSDDLYIKYRQTLEISRNNKLLITPM